MTFALVVWRYALVYTTDIAETFATDAFEKKIRKPTRKRNSYG